MTAVVTVVFTSCPTRGGQQRNQFRRRIPESYEVCRLLVMNETSYDSVVLTKDTGVIQGLPIDGGR